MFYYFIDFYINFMRGGLQIIAKMQTYVAQRICDKNTQITFKNLCLSNYNINIR
jgi:hypothetical protein